MQSSGSGDHIEDIHNLTNNNVSFRVSTTCQRNLAPHLKQLVHQPAFWKLPTSDLNQYSDIRDGFLHQRFDKLPITHLPTHPIHPSAPLDATNHEGTLNLLNSSAHNVQNNVRLASSIISPMLSNPKHIAINETYSHGQSSGTGNFSWPMETYFQQKYGSVSYSDLHNRTNSVNLDESAPLSSEAYSAVESKVIIQPPSVHPLNTSANMPMIGYPYNLTEAGVPSYYVQDHMHEAHRRPSCRVSLNPIETFAEERISVTRSSMSRPSYSIQSLDTNLPSKAQPVHSSKFNYGRDGVASKSQSSHREPELLSGRHHSWDPYPSASPAMRHHHSSSKGKLKSPTQDLPSYGAARYHHGRGIIQGIRVRSDKSHSTTQFSSTQKRTTNKRPPSYIFEPQYGQETTDDIHKQSLSWNSGSKNQLSASIHPPDHQSQNIHASNGPSFGNGSIDLDFLRSAEPSNTIINFSDQREVSEFYPTLESPFVSRLRACIPYPLDGCFSQIRPRDQWQLIIKQLLHALFIDPATLDCRNAAELPGLLTSLCKQMLYSVQRGGSKRGVTSIQCVICTRIIGKHNVARNLTHHLMKQHWGLSPFLCDNAICGIAFSWPDDRARHEKDQHNFTYEMQ